MDQWRQEISMIQLTDEFQYAGPAMLEKTIKFLRISSLQSFIHVYWGGPLWFSDLHLSECPTATLQFLPIVSLSHGPNHDTYSWMLMQHSFWYIIKILFYSHWYLKLCFQTIQYKCRIWFVLFSNQSQSTLKKNVTHVLLGSTL